MNIVGLDELVFGVDDLPGSVIFMFQPGEEGDGGAARMIAEGVLDAAGERPVAAYGVHVATGKFGVFETRAGTLSFRDMKIVSTSRHFVPKQGGGIAG